MKPQLKDYLWMCVVLFLTVVWDFIFLFSIVYFFKNSDDPLVAVMFTLIFGVLTIPWNVFVIRGFREALNNYNNSK